MPIVHPGDCRTKRSKRLGKTNQKLSLFLIYFDCSMDVANVSSRASPIGNERSNRCGCLITRSFWFWRSSRSTEFLWIEYYAYRQTDTDRYRIAESSTQPSLTTASFYHASTAHLVSWNHRRPARFFTWDSFSILSPLFLLLPSTLHCYFFLSLYLWLFPPVNHHPLLIIFV